jgi:hypothetical protein
VVLGDKKTKPGTRFRLVVVVVKSQSAARKFKQGSTMSSLPSDLPRSEFVTVKRK